MDIKFNRKKKKKHPIRSDATARRERGRRRTLRPWYRSERRIRFRDPRTSGAGCTPRGSPVWNKIIFKVEGKKSAAVRTMME